MTQDERRRKAKGQVAIPISQGLDRMWDSGFCAGLLILSQHIRDNEKPTAALGRVQEQIEELLGSMK
jgi:hypothetical protein